MQGSSSGPVPPSGLCETTPWAVWRAVGGHVVDSHVVDAAGVRLLWESRQAGAVVVGVGCGQDPAGLCERWRTVCEAKRHGIVARLSGTRDPVACEATMLPHYVPTTWAGPTAQAGWIAGEFASTEPTSLVLASWDVSPQDLDTLLGDVHRRLMVAGATRSVASARAALERPVRPTEFGEFDTTRFEAAVTGWTGFADGLEDRFRGGSDLGYDELRRVEHVMRELVLHRIGNADDPAEIERFGVEKRLSRLLDAQASRDSQGLLADVIGLLTAVVLVPGLVAGVYGSNVAVPFGGADSHPGFRAMLDFMVAGAVLTFLVVTSVKASSVTRRLRLRLPGTREDSPVDRAWPAAGGFAAALGAAIAVSLVTIGDLGGTSSTETLAYLALLVEAGAGLVIVGLDVATRSVRHAGLTILAGVGGSQATLGLLHSQPWRMAAGGAAMAIPLAVAMSDTLVVGLSGWLRDRER